MEREKIIKALELCSSGGNCMKCAENDKNPRLSKEGCMAVQMRNALALIKELIEENEGLKKRVYNQREELRRLNDNTRNLTQSRNIWKKQAEKVGKQLFEVLNDKKQIKADTVREIETRFAMRYGTYTDKDMTPITEVFKVLDQIAKEMLEG